MQWLTAWAGFVGAWLLVVGPVYQAMLQLEEENVAFDRIEVLANSVDPPPPVSAWWWLAPPVMLVLNRRRKSRWDEAVAACLPDGDYTALTRYSNKAAAWLLVGGGGFLLALVATHALVSTLRWPVLPAMPALIVATTTVSATFVVARSLRDRHLRACAKDRPVSSRPRRNLHVACSDGLARLPAGMAGR